MLKVAINGFGRIGRSAFKAAINKKAKFKVVAINDLTDPENLAYLLKYDSVYGPWYGHKVSASKNTITVDGNKIPVYSEKEPDKLPWKELNIDVVIESTGFFTQKEGAELHLKAGAKRVVISAPTKSEDVGTYVIGANEKRLKKNEKIVSNASCTTNCTAPVIAILHNKFGVKKALMTTIHSYTSTQNIIDGPNKKDLRRGRAAAENMVPTTTGAAIATTLTIPQLKNKFDGMAIRVPTPCGSLIDVTAVLKKKATAEQVNKAFTDAEKNPLYKNIVKVAKDPLVLKDIIGSPYSAIVEPDFTKVMGGDLVKVLAWYDNEYGYSCRLVEMVEKIKL
ncbi:MAG: type I glyceraldehyde-3-phosphate dehydrogenase [Candidatus Buchananbacteria bacterium]|nr:type I glyceraldehyde-3-phosphate dehydrogenase [Candidatus Buchananbacteria bacterium]